MDDARPPLVSIGVATYNRADSYLQDALTSVVNQTYPDLDIIVSDNGSTDHTDAVVESFGDPRIRYFKQDQNIGAVNNFNFCLAQAQGDYFLLLHDDDLLDEDMIEVCMAALKGDTSVGLIRTGTRVIDGEGRVRSERPNEVKGLPTADFFRGWFARKTAIYVCSTLHNTQRMKELGGFRSKTDLFPDTVVALRLAARFGRVDVPEVKASFRRHENNTGTAARVSDWCEDSLHLLDVMCELAPEEADAIRTEGLPYLCTTNYRHATSINSWAGRMGMYWRIYRAFGYTYSPIRFFFPKHIRRFQRAAKSTLGWA